MFIVNLVVVLTQVSRLTVGLPCPRGLLGFLFWHYFGYCGVVVYCDYIDRIDHISFLEFILTWLLATGQKPSVISFHKFSFRQKRY